MKMVSNEDEQWEYIITWRIINFRGVYIAITSKWYQQLPTHSQI